ncbi:MAG TPA: ABC transporter ATP-binding protein [Devosiaceae bacterium]|jgi:putative spermidine/putrescine transport system ATP-binding protein|nr:ABC transporter ATP-binding protein [Devosiaceae bacterium]
MEAPAPQGDLHVRFANVGKSYDGRVFAVRGLELDIRRGEFLTLLGPSGSGKTTALMMLAGFEDITEGEILVDGRRIDVVAPNKRDIGMVFQNYALFPHMTVEENLAFPLQVRRLPRARIEELVRETLDLVRLPGLGERRPDQLSGGQQQRVAVARALIFNPSLVLMDEPLGALDKQLREQMQFEIKSIHDRLGVTCVYVTHDQTEALTMSDRIAVFNAGAVQQLAAPDEIYERPRTDFVASFIGENNRIGGTVTAVSREGALGVDVGGGQTLQAVSPETGLAAGQHVVLSIRPERAAILEEGKTMANEFEATVTEAIFVGDHIRVVAQAAGGWQVVVKSPNSAARGRLEVGTTARIGWRAEDCLALIP